MLLFCFFEKLNFFFRPLIFFFHINRLIKAWSHWTRLKMTLNRRLSLLLFCHLSHCLFYSWLLFLFLDLWIGNAFMDGLMNSLEKCFTFCYFFFSAFLFFLIFKFFRFDRSMASKDPLVIGHDLPLNAFLKLNFLDSFSKLFKVLLFIYI